ncbi:hypothetical protein B0H99_1071 [Planomicrobium soli]|uniref:YhfM-like domain-containing protein n=1 Tax=Planomicrobium soli TaxID=1176648 RepID=A0A2P8GQE5_9BACL|nr:hypothetical protein [Planomicrobium soli]PSL36180.1 hypothetical protein B0H99_1071 [Planomicrobium soli]
MKNIALLLYLALSSAFLFSCQYETKRVEAEEEKSEVEVLRSEQLLPKREISKVEVSKTNGIDPAVYEERDVLVTFSDVFSSATRESGIANVTNPDYRLKVTNADGGSQKLYLWLGAYEEQSMLMNPHDTHTIYTMTPELTAKLNELIK